MVAAIELVNVTYSLMLPGRTRVTIGRLPSSAGPSSTTFVLAVPSETREPRQPLYWDCHWVSLEPREPLMAGVHADERKKMYVRHKLCDLINP